VKKGKIPEKWKHLVDAPFFISEKCCDVMKKKPAKQYERATGRKPLIGTMASESRLRLHKWLQYGCNAFEKENPSSQPLSFWTEQDILQYLKTYKVPYCSVYGDITPQLTTTGCDRTGCIFCVFGCHLEKEPNRFQQLKQTHPRQYEYCIGGGKTVDGVWQPSKEGLGLGKVLDYIGVEY
jgi:3'-phosphoadenosine 5'-phosphosulfate sulfotransferase (PAPS reductase)/FAD synthetase